MLALDGLSPLLTWFYCESGSSSESRGIVVIATVIHTLTKTPGRLLSYLRGRVGDRGAGKPYSAGLFCRNTRAICHTSTLRVLVFVRAFSTPNWNSNWYSETANQPSNRSLNTTKPTEPKKSCPGTQTTFCGLFQNFYIHLPHRREC